MSSIVTILGNFGGGKPALFPPQDLRLLWKSRRSDVTPIAPP
ncbi:hypothetical protein [Kovacikia minuta]|nr:hypothetical protein [Kovacikia minuta]